MAALDYNGGVPPSPDTQAIIDMYSPSQESLSVQKFFGRRRLRINHGQEPELQPEKFTPPEDQRMKWPARTRRRTRGQRQQRRTTARGS